MAEDPLDDRSFESGGAFTDDQGDDSTSSLDALADQLRDRADGEIDEAGSLASLAAELTGSSESTATTDEASGESPATESGDRSSHESASASRSTTDATTTAAGSGPTTDGRSEAWSVGDPLGSIRGSSSAVGDSPADPADVLAALDDTDGPGPDSGLGPARDSRGVGPGSQDAVTDDQSGESLGNVLVLGRLTGSACDRQCVDLLTGVAGTRVNALFVSVSQSVDDRLEAWREHANAYPVNASHVVVGGRSRAGGSSVTETRAGPDVITVDSVSDPADLTRLGITLTRRLESWAENPYPTVVCVHSVTELLQYVELRRLFRFVQVLQNTLARVDGCAHYHLDPDAHDDRTLRLFETLVEDTVRVE